jgi:hypothetical protein
MNQEIATWKTERKPVYTNRLISKLSEQELTELILDNIPRTMNIGGYKIMNPNVHTDELSTSLREVRDTQTLEDGLYILNKRKSVNPSQDQQPRIHAVTYDFTNRTFPFYLEMEKTKQNGLVVEIGNQYRHLPPHFKILNLIDMSRSR